MVLMTRGNGLTLKARISLFFIYGVTGILVVLTTIWLAISSQLLVKNHETKQHLDSVSRDYRRYTLRDTLLGDDEFYFFRTDRESLNKLVTFYNGLYQTPHIEVLTAFNQPIFINGFDKGSEFFYQQNQEGMRNSRGPVIAVKAFQLNQKAFDFYGLRLEGGSRFSWEDSQLTKDGLNPIILGSRYKSHYKVGDRIIADFYSEGVNFEVQGFLAEGSFVYYQGSPEFYLDDYMLIPYPTILSEITAGDFSMEGILYFAMLNGQFVTKLPQKDIIRIIQEQSRQSGFTAIKIEEIDDFLMQYNQLLSIVEQQRGLFGVLLAVLSCLFCYLMFNLFVLILRYYADVIQVSLIIGENLTARILYRLGFGLGLLSSFTCLLTEFVLFRPSFITVLSVVANLVLYVVFYRLLNREGRVK